MDDKINDFDVAKALFDQLKNLEKDRQIRIMRWVAESLNLPPEVSGRSAPISPPSRPVPQENQTPQTTRPATGSRQPPDIKTFMGAKSPKNDVQFATAVAYYYRFEASEDQRKESISADDLQNATRLSGRERFESPHGTLNNAKNLGYLDSAGRGAFKINTVGENLVAMTLPGQGDTPSTKVRSQTPPKAATKKKR